MAINFSLRHLRRANPDIAFLYIMRQESGRLSFVIDSDETERQAMPGQEYTEAPEAMVDAFYDPAVDDRPYRDERCLYFRLFAPA